MVDRRVPYTAQLEGQGWGHLPIFFLTIGVELGGVSVPQDRMGI